MNDLQGLQELSVLSLQLFYKSKTILFYFLKDFIYSFF